MRMFLGDPSIDITKCSSLYLRRRTYGFVLFRVLVGVDVKVQPRQASVLACVVLAGTREGLVSPRSSSVNSLYVLMHRVIQ